MYDIDTLTHCTLFARMIFFRFSAFSNRAVKNKLFLRETMKFLLMLALMGMLFFASPVTSNVVSSFFIENSMLLSLDDIWPHLDLQKS